MAPPKPRKTALPPSSSSSADAAPDPFTLAPENLNSFTSTLDKSTVYITHVDRHPTPFKKQIFAVPLALNVVITLLLVWRAWHILPWYWRIILHLLGHENTGTSITPGRATWGELLWFSLVRCATFGFDFLLVRIVAGWPITFFLEQPGNPVLWRWKVGFQTREVVVRASRGWTAEDLLGASAVYEGAAGGRGKRGGDASKSPFFKVRVLPALEREFVRSKTGYMMMNKDWDLDFGAMIQAHALVDKKTLPLEAFEKAVWIWAKAPGRGDEGQWCIWEVYKLDEGAQDEGRKKIVALKDRLTALGKESLFFRWVELVQYESNQAGGFTEARQAQALEKVKELFEEHGVDFDELAASIGGVGGMPGFEQQ